MATLLIISALRCFGGVGVKKVSTCAPTIAPLLSFSRSQNFRKFRNMGRQPLPQKIKDKRGTSRPCRKREEVGTTVTSLVDVRVPSHLKGAAKKVYEEKVRQCFAMGILAEIDEHALAIYSHEYTELVRLQKQLTEEGYVYEVMTKLGSEIKPNPLEKIVARKIVVVNSLGSQFGWSPVSRMKLRAIAEGDKKKNEFEEYED